MMLAHKDQFDTLYRDLRGLSLGDVEFPLRDIDKFHWNRGAWRDSYYNYFYRRFTSHILSRLRTEPGHRVLIIGCGFGFDEKNIRTLVDDVDLWSLDISTEMLKLARSAGSPGKFCLGVAEALPFADNTFDRVLAREVIEHVAEPAAMLREIHRVLRPNGIAIVTTENEQSLGPTNLYDSRFHPWFLGTLGHRMPEPAYKDEAPGLTEMKRLVRDAQLVLIEYFWDGALYKYLIELSPWLKGKLPTVAQYFSCLENNRMLAFLFCDQVKFVLQKGEAGVLAVARSGEAVGYACPSCKAELRVANDRLVCDQCGCKFQKVEGFFDFVLESGIEQRVRDAAPVAIPISQSAMLARLRALAAYTSVGLRRVYACTYLVCACLGTLLVPKNRKRPSRLLPADSAFQSFLRRDA